MSTNYQQGYAAEDNCKNYYKELGCIAFRTAGSHGPADVVAIEPDGKHVHFIQVKKVKTEKTVKAAYREAFQEIVQIPRADHIIREVWVKVYGKRGWAIQEIIG